MLRWRGGSGQHLQCPPDGSQIASGSYDKTVIIWNAATGCKISELKGHSYEVTSVAWSPNVGPLWALASEASCLSWRTA